MCSRYYFGNVYVWNYQLPVFLSSRSAHAHYVWTMLTPSVAHSLPLPLGPALLSLWTISLYWGVTRTLNFFTPAPILSRFTIRCAASDWLRRDQNLHFIMGKCWCRMQNYIYCKTLCFAYEIYRTVCVSLCLCSFLTLTKCLPIPESHKNTGI